VCLKKFSADQRRRELKERRVEGLDVDDGLDDDAVQEDLGLPANLAKKISKINVYNSTTVLNSSASFT
jgi:hypothetical protein